MGDREPPSDRRQHAPAAVRNVAPLLEVLSATLPPSGVVLEVGSGTGEHVVAFARTFPRLRWLPSDPDPDARASIESWTRHFGLENVEPPRDLDVLRAAWSDGLPPLVAVVAINLLHVAPPEAIQGLSAGAAQRLSPGAALVVYGPFLRADRPTAPSNLQFERILKTWHPDFGLRHLDALTGAGVRHGLVLERIVEMPANNLCIVLRRAPGPDVERD